MLEGQGLSQWHLLGEPDPGSWLGTQCGMSLGDDPSKLRQMTDETSASSRYAACAEQLLVPVNPGE